MYLLILEQVHGILWWFPNKTTPGGFFHIPWINSMVIVINTCHTNYSLQMDSISFFYPKKSCLLKIDYQNYMCTYATLTHSHTMTPFDAPEKHNEQFLFSHSVFYLLDNFLPFSSILKLSSTNSFNLDQFKICRLVIG